MKILMSDDLISQEEIDALLKGNLGGGDAPAADEPAADAPAADAPAPEAPVADAADAGSVAADEASVSAVTGVELTDIEKDALGEIGNISMGGAATTLSVLLGHKVSITTPSVSLDTMEFIKKHYPVPYLIVEVGYTVGIDGSNVLAIQAQDASIIADLMMGGDGTKPEIELNEIHMSAVGEAMNQMMGSVATSLSTMFNKKIDISPPKVNLIDLGNEDKVTELFENDDPIVRISFRMEVDGLIDSEIMQLLPVNVAREMVQSMMGGMPQQPMMQQPVMQQQPMMQKPVMPQQPMYGSHVATNVPVQPAQFTPLSSEPVQVNEANIGLILDVPLDVTVELGRTKKSIKDILDLTNGSIVELDKLAGEPVDIHINGKLLAKGEVVVIDENFGVRITDIVSKEERAARLR